MNKQSIICLLSVLLLLATGCTKFLDERPDKNLVIPQKTDDLQALLDNNNIMNTYATGIGEASADNYYLTDAGWASLFFDSHRQIYLWGEEIFFNDYPNQWSDTYRTVYIANYVLEKLPGVASTQAYAGDADNIRGTALFFRAKAFHSLVTGWAAQYDSTTAATDMGIPLRLASDFTLPSRRASVQQTYERILTDLREAVPLLPSTPKHVMRPGRAAAYALLSRVCLSMRNYPAAGRYADSCLQLANTLLDYNTLNASLSYPIPAFNTEVLFQVTGTYDILTNTTAKVDTVLYNTYNPNDLRKTVFFKTNTDGSRGFKGSYNGSLNLFSGLATDEVYLNKAEAEARAGSTLTAMNTLNTLLQKRWKTGTFVPLAAADASEALAKILTERRKELLFRDLRWMDLKRLNKEPQFAITLKRFINNQWYELPPNSPRYALPLPAYVISMTGMPQNPR